MTRTGRLRWRTPGLRALCFAVTYPAACAADAACEVAGRLLMPDRTAMIIGYAFGVLTFSCEVSYLIYVCWHAASLMPTPVAFGPQGMHFDVWVEYDPISPLIAVIAAGAIVATSIAAMIHWCTSWLVAMATSHPAALGLLAWGVALDYCFD